jgi:NADH:ubiquinone oxidoreductase subunit C
MDRDTSFKIVTQIIGDRAERVETPSANRLDFYMKRIEDLEAVAANLRSKGIGYLSCVTGLDPGKESPTLEVLYHFCEGPAVLTLRFSVPKVNGSVPSLTQIIPSAEAFERELSEMFGLLIAGHHTDYLYLPDDWQPGLYPLRKDFDINQLPAAGNR